MKFVSVSEINNYIKEKLENDLILSDLWIKGEISNFKHHYSGHMYFTLKDDKGTIRCVMFRSKSVNLPFVPKHGMGVIARGRIGVYERDGQYQLYVEEMQPDGIGALYIAFQQLKVQLEQEGLFATERKKPLPPMPRKIAVITSPTGAALRDVVTVLQRRCPQADILLVPVAVQGEAAPGEIAAAFALVNTLQEIDLIIVGRGGGSLEELWAFNTEIVARSIFACQIPVISAVGHETDFTIADFVADLRAPTPSAAAELAVPDLRELTQKLTALEQRLKSAIINLIAKNCNRVELCARSRVFSRPAERLEVISQRLDFLFSRLEQSMRAVFLEKANQLKFAAGSLNKLNPLAILERGYSICQEKGSGKLLKLPEDFKQGQTLKLIIHKGAVECTVNDVREG